VVLTLGFFAPRCHPEEPRPRGDEGSAVALGRHANCRFFAGREDFSSCQQYLRVLRGQRSLNTEVAEKLRALGVEA